MLKSPPAAFSHHSEARRTEAYALPLRSLRPCWTVFLSRPSCRVPQFFLSSCKGGRSRNQVFQQTARRVRGREKRSRDLLEKSECLRFIFPFADLFRGRPHNNVSGNASSRLRARLLKGIFPPEIGETGEVAIGRAKSQAMLDGQGCQMRIGHQV